MGWLSGYPYRKKVTISGSSGAGAYYQVKLSIGSSSGGDFHLEGHCTDFPNDIRFTDDDGTTLLDYWIEDPTQDPITVWVEVQDSLDNNVDIYCYYGKSGESSGSDGNATFLFFDDFEGSSLNLNKWEPSSDLTYSVSGSELHVTACPESKWNILFGFKAKNFDPPDDNFLVECKNVYWNDGNSDSPEFKWGITLSDGTNWNEPISELIADFWTDSRAEKYAKIDSNLYGSGASTLPHSGTAQFKITKTSSSTEVFWDGSSVLGPYSSTSSISELWLLINRYGTLSFANELKIDRILIRKYTSPEPSFSSAQSEEGPVFTCGDVLNGSSTLSSLLSVTVRSQDSLELIDSSASLIILLLNAIDSIDTSDGCTLSFLFTSSCLDVLHAIDSASYPLPNVVNCLDNLGAQDTLSSLLTVLCQSKDSIGGADGESSQLSSLSVLFDKLSSIDSTLSNVTFKQTLLDSLFLHDNSTLLLTILVFASDILASHDFNAVRLEFSSSSLDILKSQDNTSTNVVIHLNSADILKGADFISANLQALLSALSTFQQSDLTSSYKTLTGIPIKIFKAQHKVLVFRAE